METLQNHQQLCDELHQLALEENRFLQQHRRAPEAVILDRKRALLARLDTSLAELRALPRATAKTPGLATALEKARTRTIQILQLDKENEQLLLRYSLSPGAKPVASATPPAVLQKIYQRSR